MSDRSWREFGVLRGSGLHPAVYLCCREGDSGHLGRHTHVRACVQGKAGDWERIDESRPFRGSREAS